MILNKQGEKLYLDSKLEEEAEFIQESHMESDPRIGFIEEYIFIYFHHSIGTPLKYMNELISYQ